MASQELWGCEHMFQTARKVVLLSVTSLQINVARFNIFPGMYFLQLKATNLAPTTKLLNPKP